MSIDVNLMSTEQPELVVMLEATPSNQTPSLKLSHSYLLAGETSYVSENIDSLRGRVQLKLLSPGTTLESGLANTYRRR